MKKTIEVKVIPGAKQDAWKEGESGPRVYLKAPAVDGKANKALIVFLADRFGVRKRQVAIIRGLKSRIKSLTISDDNHDE
ncbi:MAG: DUF167 domain-containing protein [Candidatus Omnitrophota bacterium]